MIDGEDQEVVQVVLQVGPGQRYGSRHTPHVLTPNSSNSAAWPVGP